MTLTLSPRERTHLKGRAHALEPVVQVGKAGLSESVLTEVDRALTAHELIKVRLAGDRDDRKAMIAELCQRTAAAHVSDVGRIVVLWRPRPEEEVPTQEARSEKRR